MADIPANRTGDDALLLARLAEDAALAPEPDTFRVSDTGTSAPFTMAGPIAYAPALEAPPVIGTGVTEAEILELTNYEVETRAGATGNAAIRIVPAPAPATGTASGTFAGSPGNYHVVFNWIDEDDGVATWTLLVNDTEIGNFSGALGTSAGLARSSLFGVTLNTGDVITIQGERNDGELARVDSIEINEIVPSGVTFGAGITEFEDLDLFGYEPADQGGASGGQVVQTFATGIASGIFTGASGEYELDIDHFIENDGVALWSVRINGTEVASFDGAGAIDRFELREFETNVTLNTGDVLSVEGTRVDGAIARLDALKLDPLTAGINRAPLAVDDAGQMVDTQVLAFDVVSNDSDPDGDPVSVTGFVTPFGRQTLAAGESVTFDTYVATLNADQTVTIDPNDGFEGRITLEYILSDGTDTDIGALDVDVFPANALPPVGASFDISSSGARSVELTVTGAPIASRDISITWDDGTANDTATLASGVSGSFDHTFNGVGVFNVVIASASDVANQETTLRVVTAAAGSPAGDGQVLSGDGGINALLGDGGNDLLVGDAGNDLLRGENGFDILDGGEGADILVGGAGRDVFRYSGMADRGDRIVDFTPGEDHIRVDAAGFGGDLFPGQRVELVVSTGAATFNEDGAFLYNPVSGDLFFDVSGAGFSPPLLLARLEDAPAITARDILVAGDTSLELTVTGPGADPRADSPAASPPLAAEAPAADDPAEPAQAPAVEAGLDQGHTAQSLQRMNADSFSFDALPPSPAVPLAPSQELAMAAPAAEGPEEPGSPMAEDGELAAFLDALWLDENPQDGHAV